MIAQKYLRVWPSESALLRQFGWMGHVARLEDNSMLKNLMMKCSVVAAGLNIHLQWRQGRQGRHWHGDSMLQIWNQQQSEVHRGRPWWQLAKDRALWKTGQIDYANFWKFKLSKHARIAWKLKDKLYELDFLDVMYTDYNVEEELNQENYKLNMSYNDIHNEAVKGITTFASSMRKTDIDELQGMLRRAKEWSKKVEKKNMQDIETVLNIAETGKLPVYQSMNEEDKGRYISLVRKRQKDLRCERPLKRLRKLTPFEAMSEDEKRQKLVRALMQDKSNSMLPFSKRPRTTSISSSTR